MKHSSPNGVKNFLKHTVQGFVQIAIPKPDNPIAIAIQVGRSYCVARLMFRRIVMVAVEFNDQPGFEANKIGNVRSDRVLPPKFVPSQPPVSQGIP
jgi:hypothetical protein